MRYDGSVAGGNAPSAFPYGYLPLFTRELCTSVNGPVTIYHNHIRIWSDKGCDVDVECQMIQLCCIILMESLEYDQVEAATNAGGMSAYNPDERVNGALVRAGSGPGLELPPGVNTLTEIRAASAQVHSCIANRLGTARWQSQSVHITHINYFYLVR